MLITVIFLITGILVMGCFFGMICHLIMDEASSAKKWICTILITIISGGLIAGGCVLDSYSESSMWNNGIHENCGGHWNFTNASKGKCSTYYFYQCDVCDEVVDFSHSME